MIYTLILIFTLQNILIFFILQTYTATSRQTHKHTLAIPNPCGLKHLLI